MKHPKGKHPASVAHHFVEKTKCSICEVPLTTENKRHGKCIDCDKKSAVERVLRWRARHPTKAKQVQQKADRKRNHKDPSRVTRWLATLRLWIEENPIAVLKANALKESRRRAKMKGVGGRGLTRGEWEVQLETFGSACGYCLRSDVPMTKDHVIPVAHGDEHQIENSMPACRSCNSKKQARGPLAMLNC